MNSDKTTQKERFGFISHMKTTALFGVFLGHCLLFYVGNPYFPESAGFTVPWAVWIGSFFDASLIASFVFCSGFLFAHTLAKDDKTVLQCIGNRAKRFLVPYYVFGTLWVVPLDTFFNIQCFGRPENAGYLQGYWYMLVGCFSDHLWFFWIVFWVAMVFCLMKPLLTRKRQPLIFVITLALALVVQFFLSDFPYFKLSQTAPFFLCYFAGVCTYQFLGKLRDLPTPVLALLTVLCFAGSVSYKEVAAIHFSLEWISRLCGAFMGFFGFLALERTEPMQKFWASKLWQYTEAHGMQMFLVNCPTVYLYFRWLKPLIGQYAALCVPVNYILTLLTMYVLVWILDHVTSLFKERISRHAG
ncbi:MAG: acyltransferase [Oscillospiraceae bacterium]|nr:acyltransferase [Oscillospiraceae bacterium]